jgi:hypothetical protein
MESSQGLPERPTAKRYDLGAVSKIHISSPGSLVISRGAPGAVSISAIPEDLERIEVKVDSNSLKIDFKGGLILNRNPRDEIHYEITATGIGELDLSGGLSTEAVGVEADKVKISLSHGSRLTVSDLKAAELEVEVHNGSQLTASGLVERQRVRLHDGSQYQGAGVESRDVDIEVNDGSDATVRVREQLKARAADGSKISYVGDQLALDVKSDLGSTIRQLSTS